MPLQLLGYVLQIWAKFRGSDPPPERLPPILPIVVHHSESGWIRSTRLLDLIDPIASEVPELAQLVPSFEFVLDRAL